MTDKKLTDSEIIKALECRVKSNCPKCPYFQSYPCDKCRNMQTDALDLINRQKAEIGRLKKECGNQSTLWSKHFESIFESAKETIKAEAYKEFAEKLHEELRIYGIKDKFNKLVFLNVVDKAKKRLVDDENETKVI